MPIQETISETNNETNTQSDTITTTQTFTSKVNDNFQESLIKEEAVAAFAARNKIRESLLIAMTRDLEKGNDGQRFMNAINQLTQASNAAQDELNRLLQLVQ